MPPSRPARSGRVALQWLERLLVVVGALVFARIARHVFIANDRTIVGDGQTFIRYWEVARTSFARGDGFPLWDRAQCGGYPFLPNPETALLSSWIAGVFRVHGDQMERWYPFVGMTLAILGVYTWCRRALEIRRFPSFFAGCFFASSFFVAGQFSGHLTFVGFALIPWCLLFARLGERDLGAAAACGATLGLMAIEGGTYPVPYAIVALAITEGPRVLRRDVSFVAMARLVGMVVLFFALVGGVKVFPQLVFHARTPRHIDDRDTIGWTDILPMLIDKDRSGAFPGHYVWDEYRAYIGAPAAAIAIAGAGTAVILKPRRWDVFALVVVGALLVRGWFGPWAPYALLRKLPIYDQLRVPSRFVVLMTIGMAAAAAIAVDVALRAIGRRWLAAVVVALAVIAIYDPLSAVHRFLGAYATDPWLPRPDPPAARAYYITGDREQLRFAEYPARNVGTLTCWRPWDTPIDTRGLVTGPVSQASLIDAGSGHVAGAEVRQNTYVIDVTTTRPAVVRVNQFWDPDWRTSVGTLRRGPLGQLEVLLPAGTHSVQLRYRPTGLLLGACATPLGVFSLAVVLARTIRDRRARRGR